MSRKIESNWAISRYFYVMRIKGLQEYGWSREESEDYMMKELKTDTFGDAA